MARGTHRAPSKGHSKWLIVMLVVGMFMALAIPAGADEYTDNVIKSDHKIMNKIDQTQTFAPELAHLVGEGFSETSWTYDAHIKEAVSEYASRGVIKFTDGVNELIGHVEVTRRDYGYWHVTGLSDVFAAAGTATYNGVAGYYFIFLHADEGVWMVLSTTPYSDYWGGTSHSLPGDMYPTSLRAASVLSDPWRYDVGGYPFDTKEIH
jgi:hypothetical protein